MARQVSALVKFVFHWGDMSLRLLFYAVNGLGLGHVTRLLGIARAVRARVPHAEILFLTSSEASHVIYSEGFAAIKVPSRMAARAGGLRRGTFVRLTQSAVWNAISTFDPHGLVVDTFATGSLNELAPILSWPLRKVFVFRAQKGERAHDPTLQRALSLYDLILIPHRPDEEIPPAMAPTPPGIVTCWTGPMTLRDADEILPRQQARAALGLPPDGTLGLIALGGGGDPDLGFARQILRRALIENQTIDASVANVQWIEMAGPLEPATAHENQRQTPDAPASRNDFTSGEISGEALGKLPDAWRTLRGVHPACKYLRAFDGAICAVGYNTTYELQMAALPCVLWPFPRDVDDQAARARFLQGQGRAQIFEMPASLLPSQNVALSSDEIRVQSEAAVGQLRILTGQLFACRQNQEMQNAMRSAWGVNGTRAGAEAILKLFPGIEPGGA